MEAIQPEQVPKKKNKKGKLDSGDYWKQLRRLEQLNKSSEVKTTVVFSFHSLVLGLCADRLDYFGALIGDNLFRHLLIVSACQHHMIHLYFMPYVLTN